MNDFIAISQKKELRFRRIVHLEPYALEYIFIHGEWWPPFELVRREKERKVVGIIMNFFGLLLLFRRYKFQVK